MRILFLADARSPHTHKWIKGVSEAGFDVYLFSLNDPPINWYNFNIKIYSLGINEKIKYKSEISVKKLIYLKAIRKIREIINLVNPEILHSHYASSYGFLGSRINFHPYVISVWGSDIESFPHKSFFHKMLIRHTLNKSDSILATSSYLAARTNEIVNKKIKVVPFGVNIEKFKPGESKYVDHGDDLIIGTIKSLEDIYGIDILIRAFSLVKSRFPGGHLKLLIIGKGTREQELKSLASSLLKPEDYLFQGYIDPDLISNYHNKIDIPVYLSRKESFGVSIIESMSCGKPVVASKVGGLSEIITDNEDGILVKPDNIDSAALAIEKLVLNPKLRISLGLKARMKVLKYYNWVDNLINMISIYRDLNNGNK